MLALAVLAVELFLIFALPTFWPVMIANSLMAVDGDVFGPAVAALTLGLYVRKQFAQHMGRNSTLDHTGDVRHRRGGRRGRLCLPRLCQQLT